jgi:fructose-1,6-bisphosphatase/inositol monophosphatase family enzyme
MRSSNNTSNFVNKFLPIFRQLETTMSRDFNEISSMQSSVNLPLDFAEKTQERIAEKLSYEIEKSWPDAGLIINSQIIKESSSDKKRYFILNILDGFENFLRSIEFFANSLTIIDSYDTESEKVICNIISNPALNHFFWFTPETGGFKDKCRISASRQDNLSQIITIDEIGEFADKIKKLQINCNSLAICFLAAGKIDAIALKYKNNLELKLFRFIADLMNLEINVTESKNAVIISNKEIIKKLIKS